MHDLDPATPCAKQLRFITQFTEELNRDHLMPRQRLERERRSVEGTSGESMAWGSHVDNDKC